MILDAHLLSTFQSCPRRGLLDADFRPIRWRAKSLFDACLRRAILALSDGGDPASCVSDAKASFLTAAASPGLDVPYGVSPYSIAKQYCAMLDTLIRSLGRVAIPVLHESPEVRLSPSTAWRPLSAADDSGTLHRWITVERWDADAIARELHSWYVFGDLTLVNVPMTLHAIEIGRTRKGRRESPWARCWRHPGLPNLKMRFNRKDGSSFNGWKPVYLAESPSLDVAEWVDTLWEEGAAQALLHSIDIRVPGESVCADTRRQILLESARISTLLTERASAPWHSLPMSRASCDSLVPCPFQSACYSETLVDPAKIGLYSVKESSYSESGRRD